MRLVPLAGALGFAAVVLGFAGPFLFGGDAIAALGSVTAASLGIFIGSILIPVAGIVGLWLAVTAPPAAGGFGRLHSLGVSLALLALAAYLGVFGWIGWQTWA